MKRILLVYAPFCTPASPPYSITYLYSFLKNNCNEQIEVLDLNLEFHKIKFPEYQKYSHDSSKWKNYTEETKKYSMQTKKVYSENNRNVVEGNKPELFEHILSKIKEKKPDIVAFSLVYSSQAFYAYSLIKELKDVVTVIGGPAVNSKLKDIADKCLKDEVEFLNYLHEGAELNINFPVDFSIYSLKEYFTPKPVIPIKTSSTCYYGQCAFCSHYDNVKYHEYPLENIKQTIVNSKQKYFFIIDDMIPAKRLLKIAETFKPLGINWTCQLRPTKEMDYLTLKKLRDSGLTMIMWGVESGNDRVLRLINKGTNKKDIENVLEDSHTAGIKNIAYILFGFPTETKHEFIETIEFLQRNNQYIDLVSVSIFGLQKGTSVYNNPSKFGIKEIAEEERTVLEPKIKYIPAIGMTQEEAAKLRKGYRNTIHSINKYPEMMNFFREHMFCIV